MSQYSWEICPELVRIQINSLQTTFKQILDENLTGVYLHGSLAMGCFNLACSDIDLLVVMRQGMAIETKRDMVERLLACSLLPAPVEIGFLVEEDIRPFEHPLPFDLHYSESWRERYIRALANGTWRSWNNEKRRDSDLAAHITVTRARGICLAGKPIPDVLPQIPHANYAAAIVEDFHDALVEREYVPVYFTLNACRVLAYLREGRIYSKDEGGMWALRTLSAELHGVVEQTLEMYRENRVNAQFDEDALEQFAQYVEQNIHS